MNCWSMHDELLTMITEVETMLKLRLILNMLCQQVACYTILDMS